MRTVLALGLVTVCALGAAAQEPGLHSSKEGRFSAKFPTQPGTVVGTKGVKVGDLALTLATSEKGSNSFSIAYCDLPADALKDAPPAKVLAKSQQGMLAQLQMKQVSDKDTTFGEKKYPAREFVAERDGVNIRVLLVLAETRLYQVFVTAPKEALTGKETEAFFVSFAIN